MKSFKTFAEISKDMAGRYIKKAQVSTADAAKSTERGYTDSRSPDPDIAKAGSDQAKKGVKTFLNRNKGTSTAVNKLTGKAKVPAKESYVDAEYHKTLGPTKNSDEGIEALKKKHGMSHDQAKKTLKRLMGEAVELDEVLDTPKAMDSYRSKAKMASDKARNSATAKILRGKDDISKEKETIRKREKGLDMVDRNATRKFRKQMGYDKK
jgi:hypothetical protein